MFGKVSLDVFMDKQKSKVLFAEAESDFVDALLCFLACPLGKISKIWINYYRDETPVFGSLNTVDKSLQSNLCVRDSCMKLAYPISSLVDEVSRIELDISQSERVKYYSCGNEDCAESPASNIRMQYASEKMVFCDCGMALNSENYADYVGSNLLTESESSFIIFDDLRVQPHHVNGFSQTLNNHGIKGYDDAEMVTLTFGISDMRNLFKLALFSATPLTDFVMNKTEKISTAVKPELFHLPEKNPVSDISKKMILKVLLQKSTGKFLFAQAASDFVEFLFSLPFIPLGGVEHLFGGNTAFKCMDNLYTSVRDELDYSYFVKPRVRNMLIHPKLPYGYNFKSQFLILTEETPPAIYFCKEKGELCLYDYENRGRLVSLKLCNANKRFIMEKAKCIVRDDLSMTPYRMASTIELLKGLGIPESDVKEMELEIGFEEELRILKAALTSETVFTDALIHPMLKKMPKLEHKLVGQID